MVVKDGKAKINRLSLHPVKQLFNSDEMDIFQLSERLKSRLWQQNYAGIDNVLKKLGLKYYDILAMIKKTHGKSYNDFFWIKFEGENLTWDDVKPKNRQPSP